ncbi:Fc.00g107900.m01.CDS01 [Cosmosporella sp. VM-42]
MPLEQPKWVQKEDAVHKFPSIQSFVDRQKGATRDEWARVVQNIKTFNEAGDIYTAYVIKNQAKTGPHEKSTDLSTKANRARLLPAIGQTCKIRIVCDDKRSSWHMAETSPETLSLKDPWSNFAEFNESPPWKEQVEPIEDERQGPKASKGIEVQFHLRGSPATPNAELVALETFVDTNGDEMVEKDTTNLHIFKYYVLFHEPLLVSSLEDPYPHMFDPDKLDDEPRREFAKAIIENFDAHQLQSYKALHEIPHNLCFVPGGPGAGKTRWALDIATLAQLGSKRVQVLYLVDMNKPADDLAKRMANIYRQIPGERKKVIRMAGWAKEDGPRDNINAYSLDSADTSIALKGRLEDGPYTPDFQGAFIRQMKRVAPSVTALCIGDEPPTLDEAAWDYLYQHKEEFYDILEAIASIRHAWREGDLGLLPDMIAFSTKLVPLYEKTLADADFIATTPVAAAHRSFADLFNPDLVFYDEAAHARDLSTLIPPAFFQAKAYFFIGDHRQVTPYVAHSHQYSSQLEIPSLLRASAHEKALSQLLINHRAYGGLHELPSRIFYDDLMMSPFTMEELLPEPVKRVRGYLDGLRGNKASIPRLLVSFQRDEWEKAVAGPSSWNRKHHDWIVPRVRDLLKASWFTGLDGTTPGTIMVITSAKESCLRYRKELSHCRWEDRRRINIRTIDTSQGHEADIVFVDIVKPGKFTDNKCRLCVATTRAFQGEIIVMRKHRYHFRSLDDYGVEEKSYLGEIWWHCNHQKLILHK